MPVRMFLEYYYKVVIAPLFFVQTNSYYKTIRVLNTSIYLKTDNHRLSAQMTKSKD